MRTLASEGKIDVVSRAMKTLLLALPLLFLSVSCNKGGIPQAASANSTPAETEHEMSAAFREQAQRAYDAIQRVPRTGSQEYPSAGFDVRELDADKAIAEAKYKAVTAKDKEVLNLMDAALWGRTASERRHLLDPHHLRFFKMGLQCDLELDAELEPEHLTEIGLTNAHQKTCLTQRKTILDEIDKSQKR